MLFNDSNSARVLQREWREDAYGIRALHRSGVDIRTVLDVGANNGIISVGCRWLWPEASIYAVEPVDDSRALLEQNTLNLDITLVNAALGRPGVVRADASQPADIGTGVCAGSGCLSVPLPQLVAACRQPDLLVIDCEGGEVGLLDSGTLPILQQTCYTAVELHPRVVPQDDIRQIEQIFQQLATTHHVRKTVFTVGAEQPFQLIIYQCSRR